MGEIKLYTSVVPQLPDLWQGRDKGEDLSQGAPRTKNQHLEINKWLLSANNKATEKQLWLFPLTAVCIDSVTGDGLSSVKNIDVYW